MLNVSFFVCVYVCHPQNTRARLDNLYLYLSVLCMLLRIGYFDISRTMSAIACATHRFARFCCFFFFLLSGMQFTVFVDKKNTVIGLMSQTYGT